MSLPILDSSLDASWSSDLTQPSTPLCSEHPRLSLPGTGRVDASVSERPGGVEVYGGPSPHPASFGFRLRSATLPENGEG
jgi:hypothetical protein